MEQDRGPLDVAEELVAEPHALVRALDEPGDVGDDAGVGVGELEHPELGFQGGERVAGDLGVGRRQSGQQGGFAGIGQADQADVGEQFQLDHQPALLARLPRGSLARRPVGGGGEAGVAQPAAAAGGGEKGLFGLGQVGEHNAAVRILDDRAERHADDAVLAAPAVLVAALAAAAVVRPEVGPVTEIDERAQVAVGHQKDVPALAAIAAVGPAPGHEFFPPETDAAVTAVTGFHKELGLVDKSHRFPHRYALP